MDSEKTTEKKSKISKQQKIFAIIICSILLVNIAIGIVVFSIYKTKSYIQLEILGKTEMTSLKALDKGGRKGIINNPKGEGQNASFKFSDEQVDLLEEIYKENKYISLTVRIQNLGSNYVSKSPIVFGFLFNDDFNEKGRYEEFSYPGNERTIIKGNIEDAPEVFDISFAIKKNDLSKNQLPKGFFVYSTGNCKVTAACIVPTEVGFDISREVPFYGFSCNGGDIDFTNKSFDFTGASLIFPTKSSEISSLPEFFIKLSDNLAYNSTKEATINTKINFGGELIKIKNVLPADYIIIPVGGIKSPYSQIKINSNEMCITGILMRPTNVAGKTVVKPIVTDPGLILSYGTENWRTVDYEIFEWDRYHKILFFDTRNYEIQDNFFRRLAYFVEKQGYKGLLLTNEELEGKHGYNAHDYSAISMADFFNKAHDLNFPLNKEELLLKEILIENDLFEVDGEYVKPNEGGIVSISQESRPALRETFLAHEGWHTIFFRDEEFRNFVATVYYTLDPKARIWLADYFTANPSLQYDINDDYLMKNEFMAYIMQQDLSKVADYFVSRAQIGYVKSYTPALSDYIIKTHAAAFEDAAIALNDFVFDKYGIVCGNISLVSKL